MRILLLDSKPPSELMGLARSLIDLGHYVLLVGRAEPGDAQNLENQPAAQQVVFNFEDLLCRFQPKHVIDSFQPQVIHLGGLSDDACRAAIEICSGTSARLVVHRPSELHFDIDGQQRLSSDDHRLFELFRGPDALQPGLNWRWPALHTSLGEPPSQRPHPIFAALVIRLAADFTRSDQGPVSLRSFGQEPSSQDLPRLMALYFNITHQDPALTGERTRPISDNKDPGKSLTSSIRGWLGRRLATPVTSQLVAALHPAHQRALGSNSPIQQRTAEEIHRVVRLVMSREKRRPQGLLTTLREAGRRAVISA